MRLNPIILLLPAAVLLLAKSESGPELEVEVHTSNSRIEITGSDGDRVQVNDSSRASVTHMEARTVVRADTPDGRPLQLRVPRGSALDISTSNGAIRVTGVAGAMRLSTSNGEVTIQTAGRSEIHVHTSNGRIEIAAPRDMNANLSAQTSNGRIHSDFDIVALHAGTNVVEGKIGNGGPLIQLETSNGAIYLTAAGDRESVTSTFQPGEVKYPETRR